MEAPPDPAIDDLPQSDGGHDSQFDMTSNASVAPVFVQGDDGSMIYRSFRVREAKVCETVSFPLGASATPRSGSHRGGESSAVLQDIDPSKHPQVGGSSVSASSQAPYIFCEMQELMFNNGRQNFEWRETTRWMFFEECVEKPGDRWSKPHVPSLPAASVFDFRNCLIAGTIVLNLDASSFEELADMVGDILIATNQLSQGAKPEFLSILHLRHLHHFEYKQSVTGSLRRLGKTARVNLASGTPQRASKEYELSGHHVHVDIHDEDFDDEENEAVGHVPTSNPDRIHKINAAYRRYVPYNAQAASILVGEVSALRSQLTIFVRLARPLYVGDLTEVDAPLKFLCIILGPPVGSRSTVNQSAQSATVMENYSINTMGRVFGALLSNPAFARVALRAENREGLMAAFDSVVDRSTLLPAECWDPDVRLAPIAFPAQSKHSSALAAANRQTMRILPTAEAELDSSLTRTGQLFGGLVKDIQRKMPFFTVDFTDCLHLECGIGSAVMLLTTLTWLLVFSAMYETMTEKQIGAAETFFGACISGLIYYLASGQPLTVIGTTASLFAFERVLFAFTKAYALNYIGFHFWVIFWTLVVLFIVIMFDLSALVCYFTRFSQEIFSAFVATVLICESLASLVRIKNDFPLDNELCVCARDPDLFTDDSTCRIRSIATCHHLVGCKVAGNCSKPNSFIFSCLLFVLTYLMIAKFKSFRSSFMLTNRARVILGNFALPLTVIVLTILSHCVPIDVPRLRFSPLNGDGSFATTDPTRGLVVDPGTIPAWGVFTAAVVSIPCAMLVMMDQHFASIIVNRRENRLRHGAGYHLDLAVIGITLLISAIFGLPMYAGVVILSYANVVSLQHSPSTAKESKVGYSPLSFRIREQRVSMLVVSVLLGFCILLRGVFSQIPVAILYSIFFYIGLAMLTGTQFWHRVKLLLIPVKYQPDYKFLRYIELVKVHVFTAFQLVLFFVLWIIAIIKPIAFIFPLVLIVIAFVRRLLAYGFTREELLRLDAVLLPLSVIFRPGDVDPGANPDFSKSNLSDSAIGQNGRKIVANLRATLAKRVTNARDAIQRRFETPRKDHDSHPGESVYSDEDEEMGSAMSPRAESTPQRETPEKPPRRTGSRQEAVDLTDEIDEVQTASVHGSPSSNTPSVYASATAITGSGKTPKPGTEYQPSPPSSSQSARLLKKQKKQKAPEPLKGAKTRVGVEAVASGTDEDYDADNDTTAAPGDISKKDEE